MRKSGKSYKEISYALSIPKSTLSDWFSKIDWSGEIRRRLALSVQAQHTTRLLELNKIRSTHLACAYEEARREARKELEILKYNPLFIAGLMLYWGEGDKGQKTAVRLTNTDPELVQLYVQFLLKACGIPVKKIKANLLIYPDHEDKVCQSYWSKKSGVPWENFTKSVRIEGRHPVRRLNWGICIIIVSSTYLKAKILEWMKVLPVELMREEYYENIKKSSSLELDAAIV